ncbi:MAG TPA: glycoside hydrolase family 20 zincin-like fold domain-containing protein [Caldilineaceae bacterium]|nr:glycoside hydrolase family 20 zincin-like fold domain-containing protein [Caldilineaceae bacterium]
MSTPLSLLAPAPQRVEPTGERFSLVQPLTILLSSEPQPLLSAARKLQATLAAAGVKAEIFAAPVEGPAIRLHCDPALLGRAQSYRLLVEESGVTIAGHDPAGVFYGVCTLCQLIDGQAAETGALTTLPGVHILDWPDIPNRGVMFDVCRDRVPTMETLYHLVDLLAGLKINQLQLYTEHTFAYRGHEIVWQDASPITGEEVLQLDAYCRERHVELVPNQNSFGHMHRWLKHERYVHLAESPEGIEHSFSLAREPFSLCPGDPGSIELLADLYDQLLPHFTSRQFNVGLDETFELGRGRSKAEAEARGTGRVYLDFLLKIHKLVTERGRTMQFWSDIIVRDEPDLVAELPRDVIALEWGYEADYPFDKHAALVAASGRSFYVCPGTSSWNSLAGRTENALGNLRNAAINGFAHGAIGYLITDWGDNGHMQPLPVSYLGFLVGAAFAWNTQSAQRADALDIPTLLDRHVFKDRAGVMGRLAYDMGQVYLKPGVELHNSSPLFWMLMLPGPLPERRQGKRALSPDGLEETIHFIEQTIAPLPQAQMQRPDAALIQDEYRWVADTLRFAGRLGLERVAIGLDRPVGELRPEARRQLAAELRPLIERYRAIWLQRSRPGGLADSAARLERTLAALEA